MYAPCLGYIASDSVRNGSILGGTLLKITLMVVCSSHADHACLRKTAHAYRMRLKQLKILSQTLHPSGEMIEGKKNASPRKTCERADFPILSIVGW